MKFTSHFHVLSMCIPLLIVHSSATDDEDERFIVVYDYDTAWQMYAPFRGLRRHCFHYLLDHHTKERICKDITSTHLFSETHLLRCGYNPSRWLPVSTHINKPTQEFVFTCSVRRGKEVLRFYVSEELYEINGVATRFIFKRSRFGREIDFHGLVEVPAKTVSNVDYSIENIYIRRRRHCGMMCRLRPEDDPLCRLDEKTWSHICIAVFNSRYFEPKFTYPVDGGNIYGRCEKTVISFQTEQGKLDMDKRILMEWALSCRSHKEDDFQYLISQAYRFNEIFVFFRDADNSVFLENLSTNVQIAVDYNEFHRPAYVEVL